MKEGREKPAAWVPLAGAGLRKNRFMSRSCRRTDDQNENGGRLSSTGRAPPLFLAGRTAATRHGARALANRPSILLADEPTGNLDSKGLTIVLVTREHDLAQFAKRVRVFPDGKIRNDDPVAGCPRASKS